MATILFSNLSIGQKIVRIIDIKGSEIGILIDVKDNDSFKEYFLFQYTDCDFSMLKASKNLTLIRSTKDEIVVEGDDKIFELRIEGIPNNFNTFKGYGLSRKNGNFKLYKNSNATQVRDLILSDNQVFKKMDCHSGGKGASECSATPSSLNVGAASCSVKCNAGYYACCDDSVGECKCIGEKQPAHIAPPPSPN